MNRKVNFKSGRRPAAKFAARFFAGLIVFGLIYAGGAVLVGIVEKRAETERAELAREIRWIKSRVANQEKYTAHLQAEIKGLGVFDCVFAGDQEATARALYNQAVEAEFERIANEGGLAYSKSHAKPKP